MDNARIYGREVRFLAIGGNPRNGRVARVPGLEPGACRLGGGRSIQLSYTRNGEPLGIVRRGLRVGALGREAGLGNRLIRTSAGERLEFPADAHVLFVAPLIVLQLLVVERS